MSTTSTTSTSSSSSLSAQLDSLALAYRTTLRAQTITPVENRKTTLSARLTALGNLKTKLDALNSSATALAKADSTSKFLSFDVESSDASVVSATAGATAISGNHSLLVTQLAKSDVVVSSRFTSAANTIASNELTVDEKAAGSGARHIKLLMSGVEKATLDINLTWTPEADTNDDVLSAIASAINSSSSANQYVSASVIALTPTQSKLVITSKSTGSTNTVSLADVGPGTLLDNIGLADGVIAGRGTADSSSTADDPVNHPGGYLYSDTALLDAHFKLDSFDIERPTNNVTDVLKGVTLQLKSAQDVNDAPVTLSVGVDTTQIQSNIQTFLNRYNDTLTMIANQTATDPTTKVRQIFASDAFVKSMRFSLQTITMTPVEDLSDGSALLADIGITAGKDGTLSITDPTKLSDALVTSRTKVSDLFNSTNGIAVQVKSFLDPLVGSGGAVDSMKNDINRQVSYLTNRLTALNDRVDRRVLKYRDDFAKLQSIVTLANQQLTLMQTYSSAYS